MWLEAERQKPRSRQERHAAFMQCLEIQTLLTETKALHRELSNRRLESHELLARLDDILTA